MNGNNYLDIAVSMALGNPIENLPRMSALLLTKRGRIYIGYNKKKSHPLQALFGENRHCIYLHAEIDAIVSAMRMESDLSGSFLYVARVLRNGKPALAKPCKGCARALAHFNVREVIWTP